MSKASVVISSFSAAIVIGALGYWIWAGGEAETSTLPPMPEKDVPASNPNAIANKWQWDNFTDIKSTTKPAAEDEVEQAEVTKPELVEEVPYDVVLIYNILQDIQLDENGRVVPDQMAKYALERGFDDLGSEVTPEALAELQELIRIGLPGEAGEEAARIMKTYYEYRVAEEAFNQRQSADSDSSAGAAPAPEDYEQLVQMRRRHLGSELADGLFAVEELQARHMFSVIAIQQDTELSDEEKQAQLESLQRTLDDRLVALGELTPDEAAAQEVERLRESGASSADIYAARQAILGPVKAQELAVADQEKAQWENHFDGFWQERKNIMKASLDEAERERQIESLLSQYFNPDEQERARLTSLQWQSRERQ